MIDVLIFDRQKEKKNLYAIMGEYLEREGVKFARVIVSYTVRDDLEEMNGYSHVYIEHNEDGYNFYEDFDEGERYLFIYGYTYIEEVSITHYKFKGEKVC